MSEGADAKAKQPKERYRIHLQVESVICGAVPKEIDVVISAFPESIAGGGFNGPEKGWRILAQLEEASDSRDKYVFRARDYYWGSAGMFMRLPERTVKGEMVMAIVEALSSGNAAIEYSGFGMLRDVFNSGGANEKLPFQDALVGILRVLTERGWSADVILSANVSYEAWSWRFELGDTRVVKDFLEAKESHKLPEGLLASRRTSIGPVSLGDLAVMLRQKEVDLRRGASSSAGRTGSIKAVPLLAEALYDRDGEVQLNGISGLYQALYGHDTSISALKSPSIDEYAKHPEKYLDSWREWWQKTGKAKYGEASTQPSTQPGIGPHHESPK